MFFTGAVAKKEEKDSHGLDPYVKAKIKCMNAKAQCLPVHGGGPNPVWAPPEVMTVHMPPLGKAIAKAGSQAALSEAVLRLELWDEDKLSKDDFLGYIEMPLLEVLNASLAAGFEPVEMAKDVMMDVEAGGVAGAGQLRFLIDYRHSGADPNRSRRTSSSGLSRTQSLTDEAFPTGEGGASTSQVHGRGRKMSHTRSPLVHPTPTPEVPQPPSLDITEGESGAQAGGRGGVRVEVEDISFNLKISGDPGGALGHSPASPVQRPDITDLSQFSVRAHRVTDGESSINPDMRRISAGDAYDSPGDTPVRAQGQQRRGSFNGPVGSPMHPRTSSSLFSMGSATPGRSPMRWKPLSRGSSIVGEFPTWAEERDATSRHVFMVTGYSGLADMVALPTSVLPYLPGRIQITVLEAKGLKTEDAGRVVDVHMDLTLVRRAGILVVLYFAVGCVYYKLSEGWTIVDSLYFSIVTLSTTGYGDLVPTTDGTKLFTCAFAFVGIGIVAASLSIIGRYLLDKNESLLLSQLKKKQNDKRRKSREDAGEGGSGAEVEVVNEEKEAEEEDARKTRKFTIGLVRSLFIILVIAIVGALVFVELEGFTFVDAFYLSCISLATVGYGDISPRTQGGRGFTVAWLIIGTVWVARVIADTLEYVVQTRRNSAASRILHKQLQVVDLETLDEDGDGEISKLEFMKRMLVKMQKVESRELEAVCAKFDELDTDKSGTLTVADLAGVQEGWALP